MEKLVIFGLLFLLSSSPSFGIRIVPTSYPGKTITSDDPGTCPTAEGAKVAIKNDLANILREKVLPALRCDLGQCETNPALSCGQIFDGDAERESGFYWLRRLDGTTVQVYCAMENPCGCNSTQGGWMRIAYLNMSDAEEDCPHGMVVNDDPRACSRRTAPGACISTFFSSNFMQYSRVCGRMTGYQDSSPDAFAPYFVDQTRTIDDLYVDGVSLTYGFSPRKHIWTFAAGVEDVGNSQYHCPCSSTNYQGVVPDFVGNDYFCASGEITSGWQGRIYSENPLWDGVGCASTSSCCTFNNPPWFCKALPEPTRDNIEVRACGDQHQNDEDVLVSMFEIYVQ